MTIDTRVPVYSVYHSEGHPALALAMIASYARSYRDGMLRDLYEFIPDLLRSVEQARAVVGRRGPGVLLCSDYIWSCAANREVARAIKAAYPTSFAIFGGPSVPKYEEAARQFFAAAPYVDVAVRGEGEVTTAAVLEQLAIHLDDAGHNRAFLADVPGLTFRQTAGCGPEGVVRNADRPRIVNLEELPSPYLTGWFSAEDAATWTAAIVETNRGCPYGCTFCDWGAATLSKVRQFALERVIGEIRWIAQHRVDTLWIADANFGIFARDVEIARVIAQCRSELGCPRRVIVNYAKQSSERIADIVGILKDAGVTAEGLISIQTQDPRTLANIQRSNIKTDHYDRLIRVFRRRDLQVSSDLMIGLPGATVESFKADLQFFFDREVYAKAYRTVLLPNSPMGDPEYMKKFAIKVDAGGRLISTYSYTPLDLFTMNQIYFYYRILVGYGLLKYVLYYLQYDYGVQAISVLDDLQREINERPRALPLTAVLMESLLTAGGNLRRVLLDRSMGAWIAWYEEMTRFVERRYHVAGPAMEALVLLQTRLIPARGRVFPERIELPYDVARYLAVGRESPAARRPLEHYGPGEIEITDPHALCATEPEPTREDHAIEWELTSALLPGALGAEAGAPTTA
jgi:radical SAM superfamily enzyme YgiQ (UPF0313 family)